MAIGCARIHAERSIDQGIHQAYKRMSGMFFSLAASACQVPPAREAGLSMSFRILLAGITHTWSHLPGKHGFLVLLASRLFLKELEPKFRYELGARPRQSGKLWFWWRFNFCKAVSWPKISCSVLSWSCSMRIHSERSIDRAIHRA